MQSVVYNIVNKTFTASPRLRLNYGLAIASGDNIEVVLQDTAGITVFKARSAISNKRYFPNF